MLTLYTDPCPLHRVQPQRDALATPHQRGSLLPRRGQAHRIASRTTRAVREDGDKDLDRTALLAMYAGTRTVPETPNTFSRHSADSAAYGTAAVVAALLLQLDPFGHAHWSGHDIAIGLACAIPLVAIDSAILLLDHSPRQSTDTIRISKQSVQLMQLLKAVTAARKQGRDEGDRVPALLRAVAHLVATGRPLEDTSTARHADDADDADMRPGGWSSTSASALQPQQDVGLFGRPAPPSTVTAAQLSTAAVNEGTRPAPSAAPPTATAAPSLLDALLADCEPGTSGSSLAFPEAMAVFERARLDRVPWCRDATTGEEYVERQIVTREEGNTLRAALASMQRETVLDDFTRHIPVGLTIVYLLAAVTAQQCMQRAVVLTGASHWLADRLLEADLVNPAGLVVLPLLPPLAPEEAAGWLALGSGASLLLGKLLWDLGTTLQAVARGSNEAVQTATAHVEATRGKYGELSTLLDTVVSHTKQQLEDAPQQDPQNQPNPAPQQPTNGVVMRDINSSNARALLTLRSATVLAGVLQDGRGLAAWVCLGAALLLTGNLAACLAAATVQEAWVLVCIRLRYEEVVRLLQQHMAELRESQREFDQLLR